VPKGASLYINVDNALSIEAALHEVIVAVAFAFVSVLIVIYGFLGNLRATLIPAVTIPVSIIAAFTVMYALGYSINVLTLLGLVLAIGLVVDDAIVVLENVHRRTELGEAPMVAAVTGTREIGFAVIATTMVLAAVFVPISFLPGNIGRLFREFGFTLAAAVLFSALVALTLTPMLASKLPAQAAHTGRFAAAIDSFFKRLAANYERWLRALMRRPWFVLAGVAALTMVGGLTFTSIPSEFAPAADVGRLFLTLQGPEGASLEYTDSYARRFEQIVAAEKEKKGEISRMLVRIPGMGGPATGSVGDVSSSRAIIMLEPWSERDRSAQEISRELLAQARALPGVRVFGGQPASLGRGGFGPPVQAVIGGPDYQQLSQWSDKLLQLAERNPGLTGVDTDYRERKPQIRVSINRNQAADLGISLETVGRTLETVLGSRIVTTYLDRGREYNVILQGRDDERRTDTDLTNIYVRSNRSNELIPLSNVVEIEEVAGAIRLNRFDRLRAIEISGNLAPGYTMGEAVRWFRETVAKELPSGAKLMFDGESAEYTRSGGQLYFTFAFALAIVFLVLAAQFESFIMPAIIMVTVPLALLGAGVRAQAVRRERQHLQPDRGDHAGRHCCQERRADRRVRESTPRPGSGVSGGSDPGGSDPFAPGADDQPLHGLRSDPLPAGTRRRGGTAPADRHRRVLRHAAVYVPDAAGSSGPLLDGRGQGPIAPVREPAARPPDGGALAANALIFVDRGGCGPYLYM
jgi:multidrug efflux pump